MKTILRDNGLILALAAAVALGYLTPDWGASGGHLRSEWLSKAGVIIIFLFQGVSLSSEALLRGMGQWRLHLFIQAWISLGIPLLVLGALALAGAGIPPDLRTGFFFLAVLPTTVSSAVAFIAEADGNVLAGVFNTVCSNLLGVILVPAWILWFEASRGAATPELWPIFRSLLLLLVLPFAVGHLLHRPLRKRLGLIKRISRPLTQGIIVFIVYAAFANSVEEAVWERVGMEFVGIAMAGVCLLMLVSDGSILLSSRRAFRRPEDRIAAFFCGSHKSLTVGVPFAAAIFETASATGAAGASASLVIVPLLLYHPLQLLTGALLLRFREPLFG